MALDEQKWLPRRELSEIVRQARDRAVPLLQRAFVLSRRTNDRLEAAGAEVWRRIGPWVKRQPLWRFCTRSLGHRIFTANLVGFAILFVGLMIVSQSNRGLIDAKLDGLETQARMAAVAIGQSLRNETTFGIDIPSADGAREPESALASMALTIAPERVAPVVSRLISFSDTRVRVFGSDGFLVYDSALRLTRGQLTRPPVARPPVEEAPQPLENAWTRFMAWFVRSDLKVYRDIIGPQGTLYPEVAQALAGTPTRMMLLNNRNEQIVLVAAPISHAGAVIGVALLSSRPGDIDNLIARQRRGILVTLGVALAATLFASWLLRRTIAGPMSRLSAAAGNVTQSINARQELPEFPDRRDEVADMARTFRAMTAALYRRIEASDRFAQDVAHELRNPVAAARSTAESLVFAKSEEQRAELVRQIQGEMKRLNRLITDVAGVSRLDAELALQETEPLDLAALTASIVEIMSDVHGETGVAITFTAPAGSAPSAFMVRGHEGRLAQVITNLIDNAVSFSPTGGTLAVSIARTGSKVALAFEDQGPGIPADRLDEVFTRFYSDRPLTDRTRGKNSGLGLSISREIVIAHGGTLHAENRKHVGGAPAGPPCRPELEERRQSGIIGARFVMTLSALG